MPCIQQCLCGLKAVCLGLVKDTSRVYLPFPLFRLVLIWEVVCFWKLVTETGSPTRCMMLRKSSSVPCVPVMTSVRDFARVSDTAQVRSSWRSFH
jgi:hypothetical protein